MQEMVNWPTAGDGYEDSGEGGLFAWMVVPEALNSGDAYGADAWGNNCHVDVTGYLSRPRAMLTSPDVCVSPEASQLYGRGDYDKSWFSVSIELSKRLDLDRNDRQDRKLRQALIRSMGADDVSVPLLASVFLGSTSQSLWGTQVGGYFRAGREHLTVRGQLLFDTHAQVFGVDPIILTFLDT